MDPIKSDYQPKDISPNSKNQPTAIPDQSAPYQGVPSTTSTIGHVASEFARDPIMDTPPTPIPISTQLPSDQTVHAVTSNVSDMPVSEAPKPKSKKRLIVLSVLTAVLLLIIVSSFTLVYAVAYDKIKLKNNPKLQIAVADFVMSLPLTPKTPKFLIVKSLMNQEKISSNSFDLSLAIKTSQKADLFNLNEMDFQVKGVTDYKNSKDIDTSFNAAWGTYLNFDFIKSDRNVYFKVNTIPKSILNLIGFNTDKLDPLLNTWVSYDTGKLETAASQYLNEKDESDQKLTQESALESLNNIFDENVLKNIKVEETTVDSVPVYKLTLNADDNLVDYLEQKLEAQSTGSKDLYLQNDLTQQSKLSNVLKNLKAEIHVDKKKNLMRTFILAFDIVPNQKISDIGKSNVLGTSTTPLSFLQSKISVAMVAKFDNFGEKVDITPPQNPIAFEDYAKKANEIFPELVRSSLPSISTPSSMLIPQ